MKISGRFVRITNTKFVPDRLVIFAGEAITFKLDVTDEKLANQGVHQVFQLDYIDWVFLYLSKVFSHSL